VFGYFLKENIGTAVRTIRMNKKQRYMIATTKKRSPKLEDADILYYLNSLDLFSL